MSMDSFIRNSPDGDDWTQLYPYTIVAYQFGKRIYREFTDPREVYEIVAEGGHNDLYSPNLVITPNSKPWTREAFAEEYLKNVGLLIEAPDATT